MLKIKQYLINFCLIALMGFIISCEDLENELSKDFTTSTSNAMFDLQLTVENNSTDSDTPIAFAVTVTRLDTYIVRQDAQMIGFWSLSSQTIDGETQNISQYPQDIEFFEDNSYSKQVPNTVSGETDYFGGNWTYDKTSHQLALISQGDTSLVQTTFDYSGAIIPLDGYMMWSYTNGGYAFNEIYQKTLEPSTFFDEPFTYIYMDVSGGDISGTTYPDYAEIEAVVENTLDAQFTVTGMFEPGLDFDQGNIAVSLYNELYGTIVVNMQISIKFLD